MVLSATFFSDRCGLNSENWPGVGRAEGQGAGITGAWAAPFGMRRVGDSPKFLIFLPPSAVP